MAKNLIPEIAKMLGVELGEEFKIKGEDELMTYRFSSDELQVTYGDGIEIPISTNLAFVALVKGEEEIIKLSWKPTMYEEYWTFGKLGKKWIVVTRSWKELPYEILLLGKGWVYRTRAEAEAALPKVAAEIGAEYEL